MMIRNAKIALAALLLAAGLMAGVARAQQNIDFDKIEIKTTQVANGLYVLEGAGGNVSVLVGNDGVLMVDAQYAPMHQKIKDAVAKLSDKPIRFLINTHVHGDHTGGNELMGKDGTVIVAQENLRKRLMNPPPGPNARPAPAEALPAITYTDSLTIHFNGEEVTLIHPDPAHTDGDSIVFFRHANVIATGDLPNAVRFPNFDANNGGSINGLITSTERMIGLANQNSKVIPGHSLGSPLITVKELQSQHDMLVAVRDRVRAGIREGKSEDAIVASKPTAEFDDARKGTGRTGDAFVKMIYAQLSRESR